MRVSAAGAHLGRDPDRFHQFLRRRPRAQRRLGMAANAVGTLRGVRDGHGDELLGLLRQGAVGEDGLAEGLEGVVDRLNVPRRIAESIRRIVALMPRLESGRGGRFSRTPLYPVAMEVLDIYLCALGDAADGAFDAPEGPSDGAAIAGTGDKRPRKRRRRRRS